MVSEEKDGDVAEQTETILNTQMFTHPSEDSYSEDPLARVESHRTTNLDESDTTLHKTNTSKSVRDRRQFEPIRSGDREELHRIASSFGGSISLNRTKTRESSALERRDTLAGVNIGDAVLDPKSPEFDVYIWSKMLVCPLKDDRY